MISIVIPTYRSERNLPILLERINVVLKNESIDYEIIVVDDSSPDNTLSYLKTAVKQMPELRVISLARNFGQQIATTAGLRHAHGDAIIIMDDDLQDPPEFIPSLIHKWSEGFDVVYAVRRKRKEGFFKRHAYELFYKLLSRLSDIQIPQDSGDFCIMSKRIVSILNNMDERDRFIRGQRAWVGYRQTGIEYERDHRYSGKPAYTLSKMIKLSLDGIFSFSSKPLRITSIFGFIISIIAFIGIFITLIQKFATILFPDNRFAVWPGFSSILLSVLFIGGVQLIGIGVLGEYIGRIFNEVKKRPLYLIKETVGLE